MYFFILPQVPEGATPCKPPQFNCRNGTRKCIDLNWVLDGQDDCGDGSDESKLM